MGGWIDGWTDGWMDGWTGGWMDGWGLDGWMDGWGMDGVTGVYGRMPTAQRNERTESMGSGAWMLPRMCWA